LVQGKQRFVIPVKNITEVSYGNDVHRRGQAENSQGEQGPHFLFPDGSPSECSLFHVLGAAESRR